MTAIVGANGTGKSTLLEAITFALYGEQRKTKDTLKFYWAGSRTRLRAVLDFDLDGKRYRVERTGTDASLVCVGEKDQVIATTLKAVREACERLLGLNYDQFTNSFCAEQKNLAFLNFRNNAERQREISKMLGYDRLETAANRAKEIAKDLRTRINALGETLGDEESLKADVARATEAVRAAQSALEQAQKAYADAEKDRPSWIARRDLADRYLLLCGELGAIRGNADGLKQAERLAREALDQCEKDAAEHQRLQPQEAEYQALERERKGLEQAREQDRQRDMKAAEAARAKQELKELHQSVEALQLPDLDQLQTLLRDAAATQTAAEKALREARDAWKRDQADAQGAVAGTKRDLDYALNALQKAERALEAGVCGECGQPTGDGYAATVDARRQEWAQAEEALKQACRRQEVLRAEPETVAQAERHLVDAKERHGLAQSAIDDARLRQGQARGLREREQRLCRQIDELDQELTREAPRFDAKRYEQVQRSLESLAEAHAAIMRLDGCADRLEAARTKHHAASQELETAKARYRALDAERQSLGLADEASARAELSAFQTFERDLQSLRHEVQRAQDALKYAEQQRDHAAKRLEEVRVRAKEIAEARQQEVLHAATAKELLALREHLNRTLRPELESRASESLSLLTDGRYSVLKLSEAFEATLVEDDIPKAVISGGEEDVVALALRLALAELIQERQGQPLSLLILDEVFGSLDADRRQAVLDRLAAIKGRFAQILVISHIEEINQVADQCLYVTRDPATRGSMVSDVPPGGLGADF